MPNPVSVADRLKKGASLLGEFWRAGERCQEEFGVLRLQDGKVADCFCDKKTKFCKAKYQWLGLVVELGREIVEGEGGLLLTMTGSEFDVSGFTMKMEFPGLGTYGIGPKGVMGREDMIKLCLAPETLASVLGLMKAFPGLKVDTVFEKDSEVPIAPEEAFWSN